MIFHIAWLFAWKAAAYESRGTKALSLLQATKAVSKMRASEGDDLLHKSEDLAVVAMQSSEAWFENLFVQHSARSAHFQHAHEEATKGLQAMREKERNLLAQSQATPAPNLTAHHENSSAHYKQKFIDANATQCRDCGNAEEALVAATKAALTAHTAAQTAAASLSLAAKNYATASQGFGAANKEYTQVVERMCPITLLYSAAEPAFNVLASAAQDLKQKALIAKQHKAWEMANKTVVDAAQQQYDAAAARADAAEQPIAAKEATKAAACASIVTQAPTTAPPTPVLCARLQWRRGISVDRRNGVDGNTYLSQSWGSSDFATNPSAVGNQCPNIANPKNVSFKVFDLSHNLKFETGVFPLTENVFVTKTGFYRMTNSAGDVFAVQQVSGQQGNLIYGNTCQYHRSNGRRQRTTFCVSSAGKYNSILGGINSDGYGYGNGMAVCELNKMCGVGKRISIEIYLQ